jgi:hypothetical protein
MGLLDNIVTLLGHGDPQDRLRQHEDILTSLLVMAWMVEARDPYTGGHLWRVSRFSRMLATEAGLPDADVARIAVGGFLHDLGKISIPDHILGKKDRLTEAEYEVIKTHPEVGWRMLAGHPLARLAEATVRAHHETPDGRGYPRGLAGLAVPIDARIVGICDAFDAMTSTRPYRRGMPIGKALDIIEESLGRQFDLDQGRRFVAMGRAGWLDHVVGHSDEGIPLHECVMCGPTLVVRRDQSAGERIHCHSCTGEYLLQARPDGGLVATATGRKGSARDLEPAADTMLIAHVVRESARALLT